MEIMPVSAITGDGIDDLKANLELAAEDNKARATNGNFRLSVDRCFTIPGAGIVATGTVFSGQVGDDDHVILSPEGVEVRIRGIHAQNTQSETGQAGQRCAINIAGRGLSKSQVHRGDWLVAKQAHNPTARFDARIKLLPGEPRSLKHWTPVHVHLGAGDVPGRIAVLEGRAIEPGEEALVQIVFDRRINAIKGDKFIVRDQTARRTMAGGTVIDPFPPARGRARPERLAFLKAMESTVPGDSLGGVLALLPGGLSLKQFAQAWNLTPVEADTLWETAEMIRAGTDDVSFGFAAAHWEALKVLCSNSLAAWHKSKPESPGLTLSNLRAGLSTRVPVLVFATLVDHLVRDGKISRNGEVASLTTHAAQMAPEDNALWKTIEPLLIDGGLRPPIVHEIAAETNHPPKKIEGFLKRMTKQGRVRQVAANRFYPPEAVDGLAKIAIELATADANGMIDVRAFRDQSAIGRNLAIEVLEYFDKLGFTHRSQDGRKIIKPIADVFGKT
jgi:selenocysteine-specific elongation factor